MSSDERRFSDAEVEAIFERATSAEASRAMKPGSASDGLTLSELQEIGSQAGISPERIAQAAHALRDRLPVPVTRTFLGAPRSVARVIRLPRALDEMEWSQLVADLRATFGAQGRIQVHGALRSWSNGNLQVHVEPDGGAYRLRMQTVKGNTYPRVLIGATGLLVSSVLIVDRMAAGITSDLALAALVGFAGLGFMISSRVELPRWAAERESQMDAIAERVRQRLAG
jgi:hypothetical protein